MNFLFSKVAVSISTFLFLSICSWAQITVNSSDLPQGGTTYTLQESTPDPLQDYSTTGAGVIMADGYDLMPDVKTKLGI